MKNIIKNFVVKNISISCLISAIVVGMIMFLFPIMLPLQSSNQISYFHQGPYIVPGSYLVQQFVPQYSQIDNIDIHMQSICEDDDNAGYISVILFDENHEPVYEENIPLQEAKKEQFYRVVENVKVNAGHYYYLGVQVFDTQTGACVPTLYYSLAASALEQTDCEILFQNEPILHGCMKMLIKYSIPLSKKYYALYFAFLAFIISCTISFATSRKNRVKE